MKKIKLLFSLVILNITVQAQITFVKSFVPQSFTNNYEAPYLIEQTTDGGYILAGTAYNTNESDILLVKTDAHGDTIWTKTYGITGVYETPTSIEQTTDGGYIVLGNSYPISPPLISDIYLFKADSTGNLIWSKLYDGMFYDRGSSVKQTSDGGYHITGYTQVGGPGFYNICAIKTDALGDIVWTKKYGGSKNTSCYSSDLTDDGGYIISGFEGYYTALLIKTDSNGDTLWTKEYYSVNGPIVLGSSVKQTADGGYIMTGVVSDTILTGGARALIMKTDASGNSLWAKLIRYNWGDNGNTIQQTNDGGYILSMHDDSSGNFGWVSFVKTDSLGTLSWSKTFGDAFGTNTSVIQTEDNGYAFVFNAAYGSVPCFIKADSIGNADCDYTVDSSFWAVQVLPLPVSGINPSNIGVSSGGISSTMPLTIMSHLAIGDSIYCTTPVVIKENNLESTLQIFPNPFTSYITISFNEPHTSTSSVTRHIIKITDILGKEIKTISFSGKEYILEKGEMKPGVYFVEVTSAGSVMGRKKIVVQ